MSGGYKHQLRFFSRTSGGQQQPNSLIFAGDLGQRIFSAAILVGNHLAWTFAPGAYASLHINLTAPSHQIRDASGLIAWAEVADVGWQIQKTDAGQSFVFFNGPAPLVRDIWWCWNRSLKCGCKWASEGKRCFYGWCKLAWI